MILENGPHRYDIGDCVARMAAFRLYLCSVQGESEPGCLMQIATTVEQNGLLDRAAYMLHLLLEQAEQIELEYVAVRTDPKDKLHYDSCFPQALDSFVAPNQGGRRVNILGFRKITDVRSLVPLSNVIRRDHRRVDLRTSVWIMGRLLKLMTFVHGEGITIGNLKADNILIEPERHRVVVFDWSTARQHPDGVLSADVRADITQAAHAVIEVLGGSEGTGIPHDGTDACTPYSEHLMTLASQGARRTDVAHRAFYELVDGFWARGYYPFTTLPVHIP